MVETKANAEAVAKLLESNKIKLADLDKQDAAGGPKYLVPRTSTHLSKGADESLVPPAEPPGRAAL